MSLLRPIKRALCLPAKLYARLRIAFLRSFNHHLEPAFRIPSHLTIKERVVLSRLAEKKENVCEIGSYIGASACCFGATMKKSGTGRILCIDTWQNDAMSEGNRDTYAEFTANTSPFAAFIVPVRGFSTEVVGQVEGLADRLDLLFIDGDHSYEGVKADWEAYKHLLGPGSVVAFHDCGWAEGVKRVIAEDAMPQVESYGHLPNLWWGTIKNPASNP